MVPRRVGVSGGTMERPATHERLGAASRIRALAPDGLVHTIDGAGVLRGGRLGGRRDL